MGTQQKIFAVKAQFKVSAISLIVAGMMYSGSLYAQDLDLNLPTQPLQQSIQQLARQSNVEIIYVGDILKNKTAPKIQGKVSVEQALQQLLQGTNLTIQKNGDVWTIVEKSNTQPVLPQQTTSDPAQLPVIIVQATNDDPREDSKNNYGVNRSSSATKLDLTLKETPQSITVITQKQIEEQALTDVNKILEATPGVTVQNFGVPGAGRATFYSRGYEINNVMVDGAPTLISGSRGMELLAGMDTVIYDRVEVTRGSTGLSTGTGDPSASINFVRKRPGLEADYNGKLSWGTWGKKRVEIDASQPFTEDGRIRGRFVGAYAQGNSYIDRIQEESKILYGIVEADLGDKTTLALGGTWYDKDVDDASPHMTSAVSDQSLANGVFDGGRKWNAATDWSYAQQRTWNGFLTLDHAFNDNWKLSTNYQYSKTTPDRKWGIVGSSWYNKEFNTASYVIGREMPESKVQNLDITLLGKFDLFGREAQIATGVNGYESKTFEPIYGSMIDTPCVMDSKTYWSAICINLDDWNNGSITYPENTGIAGIMINGQYPIDDYRNTYYDKVEKQYGYFLSTKFEPFDKLKLIIGTRYNNYKVDSTYYLKGKKNNSYFYEYKPKDKWIPYAGIVYNINDILSAYASYSGIYKHQLEKDIYDNFLVPKEGNSYEIGLKSALLDNKLNIGTAIFRMKEENIATKYLGGAPKDENNKYYKCTPITGNTCEVKYAAVGPTIAGFEITAQGQVKPEWMINAGYTYLHIDQSVDGYERLNSLSMENGNYSYERPKHAINISTSYQVTEDLILGGSLRWKSKTTQSKNILTTQGKESNVNKVLSQGSYSVIDLMARYQINENLKVGLNINNLFDKTYRSNYLASLYGTPRSAIVSLNFDF